MIVIFETKRLICRSLSQSEYEIFKSKNEPDWLSEQISNPYRHLVEGPNPLKHRIPRVQRDPNFADIGVVIAIEKSSREIIGSSGFHDWPNDNGMIEIGFGIVPEKQNEGFGQELLIGMWREIIKNENVKVLRFAVSPTNEKSLHIITKFNFQLTGEQIDDEDGLELIYELDATLFDLNR